MSLRAPAVFISHGLPPMALLDDPYNSALINLGRNMEIKGIIVVSSQWVLPGPVQLTSGPEIRIQHNFEGYQEELYQLDYRPAFSDELLKKVSDALEGHGFETAKNPYYELDAGAWMPLKLIRPEADLPVIQMSLPQVEDPRMLMKLGSALSHLRDEGYLLMGSGVTALNPSKVIWHARGEDVNKKIEAFSNWMEEQFMRAKIEDILDYKDRAPYPDFAHPNPTGLWPLFFIMGTSISGDFPQVIYKGFKYSTSSLLSFCLSDKTIKHKSFS